MTTFTNNVRLPLAILAFLAVAALLPLPTSSAADRPAVAAKPAVAVAKPTVSSSPTAAPRPTRRVVRMEVTAYCACKKCCGPNAQGLTASGRPVSHNAGRFVAADPRVLPLGKRLSIPGYHGGTTVEVLDTGSAIKGNRLDVYFPSHQTALEWGRRVLDVTVVE